MWLEMPSEAISDRAFEFFVRRGRVAGWDKADWFAAERELSLGPFDTVVVPNANWAAPGYLRTLVDLLAAPKISDAIGIAQERLLRDWFADKRAVVHHGNFKDKQQKLEGDCDGLIETDDTILLIESKNEDLSMRARDGSELDILLDLADSLIKAQLQLGKLEWILRFRKQLNLNGKIIKFAERRIERMAVSLSDHGALHSRTFTMAILESVAGATIDVNGEINAVQRDKLLRLKKNCLSLGSIESEIAKLEKGARFYHTWFVPIHFVKLVLGDSKNVEEFLANLRRIKGISFSIHDVFAEYSEMQKLHANGAGK